MWPDEPFAESRGSFVRPVPVPSGEPDDEPLRTVSISCSWLPYVRGALQQLLLQATWLTDDPDLLLLTQERVFNLIDLFSECETGPGIACPFDFTAGAASDGGFVLVDFDGDQTPSTNGGFESGFGWVSTVSVQTSDGSHFNDVSIRKTYSVPITIDDAFIEYNLTRGTFDRDNASNRLMLRYAGSTVVQDSVHSITEGTGVHAKHVHGGPWLIDEIRIDVCCGFDGSGDPGGDVAVQFLQLHVTEGSCGFE